MLDSGIWKAISFALLVVAIVAIGYKDILYLHEENNIDKSKQQEVHSLEKKLVSQKNEKFNDKSEVKNKKNADKKFNKRKRHK